MVDTGVLNDDETSGAITSEPVLLSSLAHVGDVMDMMVLVLATSLQFLPLNETVAFRSVFFLYQSVVASVLSSESICIQNLKEKKTHRWTKNVDDEVAGQSIMEQQLNLIVFTQSEIPVQTSSRVNVTSPGKQNASRWLFSLLL